jgi:hypothetical protein
VQEAWADVFADAGRSASLPQEPRRGLLSGAAARTKKLRAKRTADAHQQGRRLPADAAGAKSAAHSGTVRCRLRSAALGTEAGRARWEKREEASHHCYGEKARGVATSLVGERRSIRTAAQQRAQRDAGGSIKPNHSKKGKARAQSRVPVTGSIAWPNYIFRDEVEVDKQVAAPAETRTPDLAPSEPKIAHQSADGRMATVANSAGEKTCV